MLPYLSPLLRNGELASLLKDVADREAEAGVKFKIIETAGLSMRRVLQVSNPLATAGCTSAHWYTHKLYNTVIKLVGNSVQEFGGNCSRRLLDGGKREFKV